MAKVPGGSGKLSKTGFLKNTGKMTEGDGEDFHWGRFSFVFFLLRCSRRGESPSLRDLPKTQDLGHSLVVDQVAFFVDFKNAESVEV